MEFIKDPELYAKIDQVISQMRPFFEADSGDVRLVGVGKDYVAHVELFGACKDCGMQEFTLKGGIEEAVKKVAPEITAVQAVKKDA